MNEQTFFKFVFKITLLEMEKSWLIWTAVLPTYYYLEKQPLLD